MAGNSFKTKDLLSLPAKVALKHVQENGKIYSDEMIEKINSLDLPEGRTTKLNLLAKLNEKYPAQNFQTSDVNFSVEKHGNTVNAIYKGKSSRDFFLLDEVTADNYKPFINSYIFPQNEPALYYVDAHAQLHKLAITEEDQEKYNLLVSDFPNFMMGESLREQLEASPPEILDDIIAIVANNPGHERLKEKDYSLGAGAHGSVKLVQDLASGEWNVIKVLKLSEEERDNLALETQNLAKLNQLLSSDQRTNKHNIIQNEIVMKMAKGVDLSKLLEANTKMPTAGWVDISINMLKELKDMHENGLLHRDIKVANVVCDPLSRDVKLIDFGLTIATDNIVTGVKEGADQVVKGSYAAPETEKELVYNEKTEVFTMGVAIADIFNLLPDNRDTRLIERDDDNFIENPKLSDTDTRNAVMDLVEKMTATDPNNRPTVAEAIVGFNHIREEYLNMQALTVPVAYLDVNQFSAASADVKADMIESVADVQQVWLLDSKADQHTMMFYEDIRRQFAKSGVNISEQVVQPLNDTAITDYAKQREVSDHHIYQVGVVTASGKLVMGDLHNISGKGFAEIYKNQLESGKNVSSQASINLDFKKNAPIGKEIDAAPEYKLPIIAPAKTRVQRLVEVFEPVKNANPIKSR